MAIRDPEVPEVHGADLRLDLVVREHVTTFKSRWMPGFELSLLEPDYERWEIVPGEWFKAVPHVGKDWDDEPVSGWALKHMSYGEMVGDSPAVTESARPDLYANPPNHDNGDVWLWEDRDDAEAAAEEASRWFESEHGHEHRYGHPWANGMVYFPESIIDDRVLMSAGFVVAYYTDSQGSQVRCCGIDGGGYSFTDEHFIPLMLRTYDDLDWRIATASGEKVYVTFDNRHPLVKLADSFTEEE